MEHTKDISHNQQDLDRCDRQIDNNYQSYRYAGHNSELIFTYCSSIKENLQATCNLWMKPCAVFGQEKRKIESIK